MLRILYLILKDEKGALLDVGLSYLGAKKRGAPPEIKEWQNVPQVKEKLSENILGKIGQPTEFKKEAGLEVEKPDIESAAEANILGKLQSPTKPSAFSGDITGRHYESLKDRQAKSFEDEQRRSADKYNRLGLASSTPGLQASQDISRDQRLAEEELASGLAYEDIDRELSATKMAEDILAGYTGQAQVLGAQQRGGTEFTLQKSMEDLMRKLSSDSLYGSQALDYLGKGGVSPGAKLESDMTRWGQPNKYDWGATAVKDTGNTAKQMIQMASAGA